MKVKQTYLAGETPPPAGRITQLAPIAIPAYLLDDEGIFQTVLALVLIDADGQQTIAPVIYDEELGGFATPLQGWRWVPAEDFQKEQDRVHQRQVIAAMRPVWERERAEQLARGPGEADPELLEIMGWPGE